MGLSTQTTILLFALAFVLLPSYVNAFGAGNIASISAVEGQNWRHGDIEDVLKTIACIKGHKWTSMMIKRVYFGNWLRDYSQAMDVGALKKAQPETIRILVWLLSFLSFGYATAEFEVTSERLGVYRPEEHIDNPKNYADDEDATKYDQRLRGLVRPVELQIDMQTGMKNYIANGNGDWATSAAFVKYSFERSIHHGRLYLNGHGLFKGKDEDLAEALRLMGQGLHCLEDFGAHTNYVELSLREEGFHNVFTHVGQATQINLRGKQVYPLVTGTFGMIDFYHSVLGEATDHFTQSEVDEMDNAMQIAQSSAQSSSPLTTLVKLLSKVPGTRDLCMEAEQLQRASDVQARELNQGASAGWYTGDRSRDMNDYPGAGHGPGSSDNYPGAGHGPGVYSQNQPAIHGTGGYGQQQQQQQQGMSYGQAQPDWSAPQATGFPTRPASYDTGAGSWNEPTAPAYDHNQQQGWGQQQGQQNYQAFNPNQQGQQFNNPQHPQSFNMLDSNQSSQPQWQQPQHHQEGFDQQQGGLGQQQPSLNPQHTPSQPLGKPQSTGPFTGSGLPEMPNFDPAKTIAQIYPILAFRDKVVRSISAIIEKIPGLEALVDRITETLTVFVLSLLAPFVRPVIKALTKTLQTGSTGVIDSSAQHQFEPWTDPHCTDPTHSMLSKDHFTNILNPPAGAVAAEIVKFIAPRVLYAWAHPDVPLDQVKRDVDTIFHHPAIRDEHNEVQRNMFEAVKHWVRERKGGDLNDILSSEGVKAGKNQKAADDHSGHTHNAMPGGPSVPHGQHAGGGSGFNIGGFDVGNLIGGATGHGGQQQQQQHHGQQSGGYGDYLNLASKLPIPGMQNLNKLNKYSNMLGSFTGGGKREIDESEVGPGGFGGEIGGGREFADAASGSGTMGQVSQEGWRTPEPPAGYEGYAQGRQASYRGQGGQEGAPGDAGYGDQQHGGTGGSTGYYGGGAGSASEGYYR